jgi:hypothetical protein
MTTKIDSVSTIVDSFPISELSVIGDKNTQPTYHSLLTAQKELNTNAASIDTPQGTGIHGLLVLTMQPADFATMVGNNGADPPIQLGHPAPVNPGPLPPNATAAEARTHAEELYHHQTYHSTDKALKKMLLASCNDLYLAAIKHPLTGFATTTTLQLLTHLWTTYGEIKPDDLDINDKTMATPWHPTTPIETLFLQIDDGIAFAAAGGSPINDSTAVRIIYKIIFDTGVFELPCRDWRAKANNEKTLANFKQFFRAANNDRATTTSSAGYHTANATTTNNDAINKLLEAHTKLQQTVDKFCKTCKPTTSTTNNRSTDTTPKTTSSSTTRDKPTFKGYCHTHGTTYSYREHNKHTSANCKKPADGHNKAATEDNKLGGSEREWVSYTTN